MKVFITGASGFIGGALAKKLARENEVLAMARSDRSAQVVVAHGATPVRCNLETVQAKDLQGCDKLIHSAAFVEPWGSREQFWQVNVEGTRRMLAVAKEAGVKQFIHIGTEAALFYGQDMIEIDETYPYAENSPYLYSETKAAAEKLVLAANEPGVFETVSVRPRFVWGPDDQTILPNVLEMVRKGSFKWVNGGKVKASTTYIDNLVHGIELSMEKGRGGEAYFVTDGEAWTIRKFMTSLLATQGVSIGNGSLPGWLVRFAAWNIESVWKIFGLKSKPPITRFSAGIMSSECTIRLDKARQELGYEPVVSIPEGMDRLAKSTRG